MVQEARLDLSRPAALLGLALVLGGGVAARAQPLMPNPGLTSLLQPQRLERDRPLMPEDRTTGTRSSIRRDPAPGATPCTRRGSASPGGFPTAPAGPSLYGGGSGPGDYGRYIPGAPPPADSGGKKPTAGSPPITPGTSRTAVADRPLYGGNDRPLWDTGERRPASPSTSASSTPASPGEAGKDPAGAAPAPSIPAPVRDRPLWANASPTDPADPAPDPASSAGGGAFAASPCTASPVEPAPR